jgi:hypothetical protein
MEELTNAELLALRTYFDGVTVNLTSFAKKHGRENTKHLNSAIDKIYKDGNQTSKD